MSAIAALIVFEQGMSASERDNLLIAIGQLRGVQTIEAVPSIDSITSEYVLVQRTRRELLVQIVELMKPTPGP